MNRTVSECANTYDYFYHFYEDNGSSYTVISLYADKSPISMNMQYSFRIFQRTVNYSSIYFRTIKNSKINIRKSS